MKFLKTTLPFFFFFVGFLLLGKTNEALAQSCSASYPARVQSQTDYNITIQLPGSSYNSVSNICGNGTTPCMQLKGCSTISGANCGPARFNVGSQEVGNGVISANATMNYSEGDAESGPTNVHFWVEYNSGSSTNTICREENGNPYLILVTRNTSNDGYCDEGPGETFDIVRRSDGSRNLRTSDELNVRFDGNHTYDFNTGEYPLFVRLENGDDVPISNLSEWRSNGHLQARVSSGSTGGYVSSTTFGLERTLPPGNHIIHVNAWGPNPIEFCEYPFSVSNTETGEDSTQGSTGPRATGSETFKPTEICQNAPTECSTCVSGGGIWTAIGCIPSDIQSFVTALLNFSIGIAGGIAFIMIIYGGFITMMSAGNPEKLNHGREILVSAISGLLLIVFSAVILKIVGIDILQIPGVFN